MGILWCILAFLMPPLGLHYGRASRFAAGLISIIWIAGQLVFWLFMAGPGFALCLLASLAAVVAVVRARRKARA
ncbi:hypothetical protein IP83_01595 [Novosphingobium sp. AAP93]|nr:hypothetical protein IP83_01595 [Novosphingobium sp. AAP93]